LPTETVNHLFALYGLHQVVSLSYHCLAGFSDDFLRAIGAMLSNTNKGKTFSFNVNAGGDKEDEDSGGDDDDLGNDDDDSNDSDLPRIPSP
jgi:hypothetical protein